MKRFYENETQRWGLVVYWQRAAAWEGSLLQGYNSDISQLLKRTNSDIDIFDQALFLQCPTFTSFLILLTFCCSKVPAHLCCLSSLLYWERDCAGLSICLGYTS